MIDQPITDQAASRLARAYQTGVACPPVRDLVPDIDTAYAIQASMTEAWLAKGRRLVGRKIGLTAASVQQQLGINQPDCGALFADMAHGDGDEVPIAALLQPRVAGAIAFCLSRDLTMEQPTLADVIGAIDYAVASIEIVDSRIAGWDVKIIDTIADNASSGRFVLGAEPKRLGTFDPRLCGAVLEQNGQPVSFGAGAASLGNPLIATLWLAKTMADGGQLGGRPLRAGDIVLSGALGPIVPARGGDVFELRINGVGSVRVAFSAASESLKS
jgi:2-keto-4-pentenoate hydratase